MALTHTETHPADPPPTLAQPTLTPTALAAGPPAAGYCLVVSVDPRRQSLLVDAAAESGWATLVCGGRDDARQALFRWAIELALVDLRAPDGRAVDEFRALAEEVAARRDALVALCGAAHDEAEEVWARQLGVWLYLPSITARSDLTRICGDALRLTGRRVRAGGPKFAQHRRRSAES